MASVVASGLFNAVAFAGAGYLFKTLDKGGYEKEMERHNKAMEQLTRDKEQFYEEQVKKNSRLSKLREQARDASEYNKDTLSALHEYKTVKEELDEMREPVLSDYYKPSKKMDNYMELVKLTIGGVSGWFISGLIV